MTPAVRIGQTDLHVPPLGVGTWAWGDKPYWFYGTDHGPAEVVDAFTSSVDAGLTLFDTAEVYGHGESEKILGWMAERQGAPLVIATKFALLQGRPGARALRSALENSLRRLRVPRIGLYQVHWPDIAMASIDELMHAMADAVEAGKIAAVGVSNFTAAEVRAAHAVLARRGVPLASNQVHYSLVHRAPEADGVLDACRELGVTLLAYSPLEQGLLTGKYDAARPPRGPRARLLAFSAQNLAAARPLVALLGEIGAAHGGRSPEQVALRWLVEQEGVLPIAGAKTGPQAERNAGALAFSLESGEWEALDRASRAWRGF
jgi:aryl-alcohol dehydrogenase-like predicted oxidoreductase